MYEVIVYTSQEFAAEMKKARESNMKLESVSTEGLPWRARRLTFAPKD